MPGTSNIDLNSEETLLAQYIVSRLCDRLAGRIDSECFVDAPRDVFFIGNLRPQPEQVSDLDGFPQELRNKLAPTAFGADFQLANTLTDAYCDVTLSWNCYYRVFPSLQQQRDYQLHSREDIPQTSNDGTDDTQSENPVIKVDSESGELEDVSIADEIEQQTERAEIEEPELTLTSQDRRDDRRKRASQDSLYIRFRKIECSATARIAIALQESDRALDNSTMTEAIELEIQRAVAIVAGDPDAVRVSGERTAQVKVPSTALENADSFSSFIATLTSRITPQWRWTADFTLNDAPAGYQIECVFSNTSLAARDGSGSSVEVDPNYERYFFDVEARFEFGSNTVRPFEVDLAPKGFRYDRELWGRGFNCGIERLADTAFVTSHTPALAQMRYATRVTPKVEFEDLANDPIPVLSAVLKAMEDYEQDWEKEREKLKSTHADWMMTFGIEFENDKTGFQKEIESFRKGLSLITNNPDILKALRLTNETFRRAGLDPIDSGRAKNSWRLFQIVFIVSQVPGIYDLVQPPETQCGDRERVDIIYFPTGGGKTEAYLGTVVLHCFFDRLRGKTAGLTAWTRFPLRLLTLQQTQRMADIIGIAELVRREQIDDDRLAGESVDGFSVGYFVGKEATPNELVSSEYRYASSENKVQWAIASDQFERQRWKRIVSCPSCRTKTISVEFDEEKIKVIHKCSNGNCAFPNGVVPMFVVDNEAFRYLPSVIVGTIDKLAALGNQRKLAQLFGDVDGRCAAHGYYKIKCTQKDCVDSGNLVPGAPNGVSGPSLFIQDELHLLKEGLGTFDGHYETFAQELQRFMGESRPVKIIASSATIEAFERQVEHLYGRSSSAVFPGSGPTLRESFYAETLSFPQRIFVGILPHNKTLFNSLLELIEVFHREMQDLLRLGVGEPNPFGGLSQPGTNDWRRLLDPYVTSLSYFMANRELDEIRTDLIGDVNPNLTRAGYREISPIDMTGSTTTDEVTQVLERLEEPSHNEEPMAAVLATSMISHGVDVNRLNLMFFHGMPRQTAEYIQASSRVGRSHVGIVLTCLHPARERDQSHYTYFAKYHEFIGQLVEPVAINRWAKFSLKRTLPGLFMGVLLQILSNRPELAGAAGKIYMLDFVKKKISEGLIRADQFVDILERAYMVDVPDTAAKEDFRKQIRGRVQRYLDNILASTNQKFVSEALIPPPMSSLRDVDEAIEIRLDSEGSGWASRRIQHRV